MAKILTAIAALALIALLVVLYRQNLSYAVAVNDLNNKLLDAQVRASTPEPVDPAQCTIVQLPDWSSSKMIDELQESIVLSFSGCPSNLEKDDELGMRTSSGPFGRKFSAASKVATVSLNDVAIDTIECGKKPETIVAVACRLKPSSRAVAGANAAH